MRKRLILLLLSILLVFSSCSSEPKQASEDDAAMFIDITGFSLVGWLTGGEGIEMIGTGTGFRVIYNDCRFDSSNDENTLSGMVIYEARNEGDHYSVDLKGEYEGKDYHIESSFYDGEDKVTFKLNGKSLYT